MNNKLFDQLAERGFAVVDRAFFHTTYKMLVAFLDQQIEEDQLRQAGIGSLSQFEVNKQIRGDEIQWLKRGETSPAIVDFYGFADELIRELNRELFLSLSDGSFNLRTTRPALFTTDILISLKEETTGKSLWFYT